MILAAAPKVVDGKFKMHLRSQTQFDSELGDAQGGAFKPEYRTEFWQPAQTAALALPAAASPAMAGAAANDSAASNAKTKDFI